MQLSSIIPQPLQGLPLPAQRVAAACWHGGADCPCWWHLAARSSSPQTPPPLRLPRTPQAARVGFYNPSGKTVSISVSLVALLGSDLGLWQGRNMLPAQPGLEVLLGLRRAQNCSSHAPSA